MGFCVDRKPRVRRQARLGVFVLLQSDTSSFHITRLNSSVSAMFFQVHSHLLFQRYSGLVYQGTTFGRVR
jgi:hypothetical protein